MIATFSLSKKKYFYFKGSQLGGSFSLSLGCKAEIDPETQMSADLVQLENFFKHLPVELEGHLGCEAVVDQVLRIWSQSFGSQNFNSQDLELSVLDPQGVSGCEFKACKKLFYLQVPVFSETPQFPQFIELKVWAEEPICVTNALVKGFTDLKKLQDSSFLLQFFPQSIVKWRLTDSEGLNWESP